MLLAIATTQRPTTDLGLLLHKHPNRVHTFDLAFGKAHVFYPQAGELRCVATLLLDVDPIGPVRGKGDGGRSLLAGYVNDRPCAAPSFPSVASARIFGSTLAGAAKNGRRRLVDDGHHRRFAVPVVRATRLLRARPRRRGAKPLRCAHGCGGRRVAGFQRCANSASRLRRRPVDTRTAAFPQFTEIVGVNASAHAIEIAARRLKLSRSPAAQQSRAKLLYGALACRDRRLEGSDAAAVAKVVEHLDPARLGAFEQAVFQFARPRVVAATTPNREYNALFEFLPEDRRHRADRRCGWARAEFAQRAHRVANDCGYTATHRRVGEASECHGTPTQMAAFER